MAATARLACTHCTHRAQNRRHNACEGRGISVGRERGRINISSSTAHLLRRGGLRARLDQQALRQGALAQQRAQHLRAATHHEQHRAHNNACEGRVISVTRDRGRSNISWRAQNACGCRVISVARGRGRSDISIITTCMGSAPSCVARQCSTSCSAPTQCIAAGWRRPLRLTLSWPEQTGHVGISQSKRPPQRERSGRRTEGVQPGVDVVRGGDDLALRRLPGRFPSSLS
jgi:hypothetical protein